jgi:hypothetical protein
MGAIAVPRLLTDLCTSCGRQTTHCSCLHDVRDPSAFVQGTINAFTAPNAKRGPIVLSSDERDELHQEGLAILYRLASIFEPHREGYDQAGRFSGFAAAMLPRKLGDAWHRMHPEHRHVTDQETGKRHWEYTERAVSLEALTAEDPDRHQIMASQSDSGNLGERLHAALLARSRSEFDWIVQVGKLVGAGASIPQIAEQLGIVESTVERHIRTIVRAQPDPRHMFTKVSEMKAALEVMIEADARKAARVGELLGAGSTTADIAQIMEISDDEVKDHTEAIKWVMPRIESEER